MAEVTFRSASALSVLVVLLTSMVASGGAPVSSALFDNPQGDSAGHFVQVDMKRGRIAIPERGIYLGARVGSGSIKDFEETIGKKLAIVNTGGLSWEYSFPAKELEEMVANGNVPLVSWAVAKQEEVTREFLPIGLQDIIDGKYDDFLTEWATDASSFQYPILLRFGWEMTNGNAVWTGPNNFGKYGNQSWDQVDDLYKYYGDPRKPDGPERYVDAWKHAHGIFQTQHADNVEWVWCPGVGPVPDLPWNVVENYYPGDDYVDWVGAHVFNFGYFKRQSVHEAWWTFEWVFEHQQPGKVYYGYPSKPFMIAEISCTQEKLPRVLAYDDKAQWIVDAIHQVRNNYSNVKAIVWFSSDKSSKGGDERDWRVDYPTEVLEAFKHGISDSYFIDHIPFEYRAVTTGTRILVSQATVAVSSTRNREDASIPGQDVYLISGAIAFALLVILVFRRRPRTREIRVPERAQCEERSELRGSYVRRRRFDGGSCVRHGAQ